MRHPNFSDQDMVECYNAGEPLRSIAKRSGAGKTKVREILLRERVRMRPVGFQKNWRKRK